MKSFILYTLLIISSFACTKQTGNPDTAQMKFINASINAPKLELTADGALVVTDVSFPFASNYFFVNAGRPNLRIAASSGPTTGLVVSSGSYDLAFNTNYTLIVTDSVNKIKVSLIQDTIVSATTGKAKIRFFHLANDVSTVGCFINSNALSTGRFFNDQGSDYTLSKFVEVDAGTASITIKNASATIITTMPNITLQSGKLYTLILKGTTGGIVNTPQALGLSLLEYN
jgi:hypothetical protein